MAPWYLVSTFECKALIVYHKILRLRERFFYGNILENIFFSNGYLKTAFWHLFVVHSKREVITLSIVRVLSINFQPLPLNYILMPHIHNPSKSLRSPPSFHDTLEFECKSEAESQFLPFLHLNYKDHKVSKIACN
jgi:hypothetical protein